MNKKLIFIFIIMMFIFGSINAEAYNYTMSWNFRYFNNPNARQVAINIAEKQEGLVEREQDEIDRFQESFERRLMSSVQRSIINQILGETGLTVGEYMVGDLSISIAEDPNTGEVIMEIINVITGDSTLVTYAVDYWQENDSYFWY